MTEHDDGFCGAAVRSTLDAVGGRWSMLVLWELLRSERRYADLHRRVLGISQKVLSAELRSLVAAGLVEREVVATVPPQVTYRITDEGRSLGDVFEALEAWGRRHAERAAQPSATGGRSA